jgi:hypothetical protein
LNFVDVITATSKENALSNFVLMLLRNHGDAQQQNRCAEGKAGGS